jgi:hypothetical protein
MTWHSVVHEKAKLQAIQKNKYSLKSYTVPQDLTHVCQPQSKSAMCCCNDIISQRLFSLPFLHTHASRNTGGVNNVSENFETAKQQNGTKFANFSTCHNQRNTEVHEQSETVMLWANKLSQDVSC